MGGINFNTGGGTSFDPANPGPIGGTTPSTGAFTRLSVAQGTLTDPVTGLNLTATWNDAADTFRCIDIQITNTASAAGSTYARVRGGVSGTTTLWEVVARGDIQMNGLNIIPANLFGETYFDNNGPNIAFRNSASGGVNMFRIAGAAIRIGAAAGEVRIEAKSLGVAQLGLNHATTPTAQRIQAHGVGIGTGASLTLGGGSGDTKGDVILDGGNRSVYIASPSATEIRDILISHGLMAAS
jgi:hypothetical protein